MHMFKEGKWNSPPPKYKAIMNGLNSGQVSSTGNKINSESGSNLEYYINMSEEDSMKAATDNTTKYEANKRPLSLVEFHSKFTTDC
jgi:hypothetical protein